MQASVISGDTSEGRGGIGRDSTDRAMTFKCSRDAGHNQQETRGALMCMKHHHSGFAPRRLNFLRF